MIATIRHDWLAARTFSMAYVRAALTVAPRRDSPRGSARARAIATMSGRALGHAAAWLNPLRLRCAIVGHDDYLARERYRLFLRCGVCGRGTRGWVMASSGPRVTAGIGGARTARHRTDRMSLV